MTVYKEVVIYYKYLFHSPSEVFDSMGLSLGDSLFFSLQFSLSVGTILFSFLTSLSFFSKGFARPPLLTPPLVLMIMYNLRPFHCFFISSLSIHPHVSFLCFCKQHKLI